LASFLPVLLSLYGMMKAKPRWGSIERSRLAAVSADVIKLSGSQSRSVGVEITSPASEPKKEAARSFRTSSKRSMTLGSCRTSRIVPGAGVGNLTISDLVVGVVTIYPISGRVHIPIRCGKLVTAIGAKSNRLSSIVILWNRGAPCSFPSCYFKYRFRFRLQESFVLALHG